jgi:ERCC4-type nuclease
VNETIDFKVGKARRKRLHDLCDELERELPGLRLDHSSSHETATRRILIVKVEKMSTKRPLFSGSLVGHGSLDSVASFPAAKRLRSDLPSKVAAAQAAMERQALCESLLESKRRAVEESIETAQKRASAPDSIANDNEDDRKLAAMDGASYKEMERRAIEESLKTARMSVASPASEDEMTAAIQESLLSANQDSSPLTPFSDRKLPTRDKYTAKQRVTAKRELFSSDVEPIELSSDDDDEIPPRVFNSGRDESIVVVPNGRRTKTISLVMGDYKSTKRRAPATKINRKAPLVINLDDDDDEESQSDQVIEINDSQDNAIAYDDVRNESQQSVIILDDSLDCIVPATPPRVSPATPHQLYVLIDNRERNRNATPRHLRMELTSLVTTGALRSVWPQNMPAGNVAEMQLAIGDFAFDIEIQGSGRKRIPIAVERKGVGDLVQRSVKGDHWGQFSKIRDECRQAIFLIENDTRTAASFTAYGSQELDGWTPNGTTIDDEKSIFLFFGRALLSSPTTKFIQTRDEISSLRAVGALGIMAACSEELVRNAAKTAPPSSNNERALVDRLTVGGIPWKLAQQMGKSLGSIRHLEFLYKNCSSDECRSALLVPFVAESDYNGLHSTSVGWSEAIYRVFHATQAMSSIVRVSLSDNKHKVEDHGRLISALCSNKTPEEAVDAATEASAFTNPKTDRRRVSIELSQGKSQLFPAPTENSFYSLKKREKNPMELALPTIVMRTSAGRLSSHRLFVHLLQAKSMVLLITSRIHQSGGDCVTIAKDVANSINCDCYHRSMKCGNDRRVLLLCGLTPALDAVAKKADYRQETRVLVDLVLAQLMLAHDLVVIQAVRLSGDTELILQQLALACFHYHLLFQDGDY